MKKIMLCMLLLLGFAKVEAQNQNYLPDFVQRVPQQKFVEAMKYSLQISDEDLPVHAHTLWVNAWFGRASSKNGNVFIKTLVSWEWNDAHFYNGSAWVQGNITMSYPGKSTMVNALGDLQIRAEHILGIALTPYQSEFPDDYVERILNLLAQAQGQTNSSHKAIPSTHF